MIVKLVIDYWWLLVVVGYFAYWVKEQPKEAQKMALNLILQAERAAMNAIGIGIQVTGPEKMANVVESLAVTLPSPVRVVIGVLAAASGKSTHEYIQDLCQKVYEESKGKYQDWIFVDSI